MNNYFLLIHEDPEISTSWPAHVSPPCSRRLAKRALTVSSRGLLRHLGMSWSSAWMCSQDIIGRGGRIYVCECVSVYIKLQIVLRLHFGRASEQNLIDTSLIYFWKLCTYHQSVSSFFLEDIQKIPFAREP